MFTNTLFIFTAFVLLVEISSRPEGPPLPAACIPENQLVPQHVGTAPQTSAGPSPTSLDVDASYVAGATLTVTINATGGLGQFKGYMIQARTSESGTLFGTFRRLPGDTKSVLFGCPTLTDFNTAAHSNPDPVETVTLNWAANQEQLQSITEFRFYYTVVANFSTYWVKLSSDVIQVGGAECSGMPYTCTTPENELSTRENTLQGNGTALCARSTYSLQLIKSHGCVMCVAWGLLAPVGILIAMFYKVIWPNGEWFYSHLGIMIGTLVFTLAGLVLIVVHASGRWLTSTSVNLPHQIFGIVAAAAVGINPFIAILRCDPSSQWRWIYNWTHGITGLILGQLAAFCAMLLGLNVYRECGTVNEAYVHYAIYTVSATVGVVIAIMAFYNIYAVNYRIWHPSSMDMAVSSEPPGSFTNQYSSHKSEESEEEDEEPSEDYPLRAAFGIGIIVLLLLLTVASVTLLALT